MFHNMQIALPGYIQWTNYLFVKGREVGNLLISFLLVGSCTQKDNALWSALLKVDDGVNGYVGTRDVARLNWCVRTMVIYLG